jgi:hypothetical protein
MSTEQQIEANRQNAQSSTGPVSEAGKQVSSQNAVKHSFTGLTLRITEGEEGPYFIHVDSYMTHYKPATYQQEELVQQLADLHWTIHQINVQQMNTISPMNAVHAKDDGQDPIATAKVIAGLARTLNNLNLYEVRRHRAARAVREKLEAVLQAHKERLARELPQAAELSEVLKEAGQTFDPLDFGFVCSSSQIQQFVDAKATVAEARNFLSTAKSK